MTAFGKADEQQPVEYDCPTRISRFSWPSVLRREDFRKGSEDGACLIETDFVLLEVSLRFVVIPFDFTLITIRFVSINPQGKPAGLQSIPNIAGQCRCGLIDTGRSGWFPILICSVSGPRSRSRSQAKFSKEVLRKEVIQPQVPLRLPCYDLVPITGFIFGACLAAPTTSDAPRFGGLTGGVYKAQEHIHRRSADRRLLAIPASCGRVAARNPN